MKKETKTRQVCIVTGTRADYGLLFPILDKIKKDQSLTLRLIVVGMHLSKKHGYSVSQIVNDGFKIQNRIPFDVAASSNGMMGKMLGQLVSRFSSVFEKNKPDILFLFGDRVEMLAAALAGAYMNIPIFHYHGGDKSGTIDDIARHTITKLSNIHFVSNKDSANRVQRLGEQKNRIHVVGTTAMDNIKRHLIPRDIIAKKYGIDLKEPLIIVLQHSVSHEERLSGKQMMETLEAVKAIQHQTLIIYPNSDLGGARIINVILKYRHLPRFIIHKNLPHFDYLSLLNMADVLVGNSSSGIVEAGFFNLPVVNIGTRQKGRLRGKNVIDVPHDRVKIQRVIERILCKSDASVNHRHPYTSKSDSATKIIQRLKTVSLNAALMEKEV